MTTETAAASHPAPTRHRPRGATLTPPGEADGPPPTLVLGLSDLGDLRHLADVRRCVRAELADLPPGVRDDVALAATELVAGRIRSDRVCRSVRLVRLGYRIRIEVDAPAGTGRDGGREVGRDDERSSDLLEAVGELEVVQGPGGWTVRCDVAVAEAAPLGIASPRPPTPLPRRGDEPLAGRLHSALADGGPALEALATAGAADDHDRLVALSRLHGLHTAPLEVAGPAVRFQHHPALAALTWRLESEVLADLEAACAVDEATAAADAADPVAAMRAVATRGLVPEVYRWAAEDATLPELVDFLALEGGPDAGFDDLVAACQVGLHGEAKLELARNYWDEMGRGEADAVHTVLHDRLVAALGLPRVPPAHQPVEGLLRSVLGSLLVRNRWLQPELVGALGLLELQAGPRCRKVVAALRRLDAPADALPFYVEHAEVDPLHGKAWLDHAVRPLGADPEWARRMVRGARWRAEVNRRFFGAMADRFVVPAGGAAG